ncbi:MAG: ester cyclase [Sediminibacterium sp.]
MKKTILSVLILSALFGSNTIQAQKKDLANGNVKFYNHVWDVVLNEGRVNILDTAYAENAMLHTTPATMGKANCIAYYANYISGFSNRQFTVRESIAQGNKVVKYWQFKGKHTGSFFGIPATNKEVDVIGCTIATVVNGKITEEQDFMDNLEFFRQLGLMAR